jgi:hypothetical protein
MTTNKRLLISESYGDSNWCTSYRRNLIQMTCTHSWQAVCGNLSRRCQRNWAGLLLPRNKYSWRNPQPGWVIRGSHTVSLLWQPMKQWGQSQASIDVWLHQFTGPITPARDQYVQYLLAGANPSFLNQYRRGLQPWRCQLSTSHSPTFPTDGPPLSTYGHRPVSGYPTST